MSTQPGSSDPARTRRDIQQTRAQLGETVAALAAKADVRTRVRTRATTAAGGLRQRVTQAGQSAKTTATQLSRTVGQKATQRARSVRQKAQQTSTTVRDTAKAGVQTTSAAESDLVSSARDATTRIGSSVRAKPAPALAAAVGVGAAVLAVVAYRRRPVRRRRR